MRFKNKQLPNLGDERTIYRFALFPTRVGEYTVWLERYAVHQKYDFYNDSPYSSFGWKDISKNICDYYI